MGFFVEPFEKSGYIARRFRVGDEGPGSADRPAADSGVAMQNGFRLPDGAEMPR